MPELPVLGQPGGTNNPLVVLNAHLEAMTVALRQLVDNTSPTRAHEYALAPAQATDGSKVWGAYCTACSEAAGTFTYPCMVTDQVIRPPQFFTVGVVYAPGEQGLVPVPASPLTGGEPPA